MYATNLENEVDSSLGGPGERDGAREDGAGRLRKPHRGDAWTLVVTPPPWYAGTAGARVVVESASSHAVFVRFESGVRDSFPPGRFAAYFELAVAFSGDQADL